MPLPIKYNKVYRNPKLDKIFDKITPINRALLDAGEFGKPVSEVVLPSIPLQQLHQQLLQDLRKCQYQILYYTELQRIYQERLSQLLEQVSDLPCDTSPKRKL